MTPDVRVTQHTVCCLPEGSVNRHHFQVIVEYRGGGWWAVLCCGQCRGARVGGGTVMIASVFTLFRILRTGSVLPSRHFSRSLPLLSSPYRRSRTAMPTTWFRPHQG